MAAKSAARPGVLHGYTRKLAAFEYASTNPTTSPQNLLLFIGGLTDGLLTSTFTDAIASSLPPTWCIAQPLLSSSYKQWGFASLQTDVAELSRAVSYFRTLKSGKIVLMGHSTGCQDIMEYLTGPGFADRAKIDGGILQSSVSDREALVSMDPESSVRCKIAQSMVTSGNGEEIMPSAHTKEFWGNTPITARRFLAMASPNHDGEDDYFSTDLSDEQLEKTFGRVPAASPLCILYGGEDEYALAGTDKKALVERWIGFVKRGWGRVDEVHSGVVEGANHGLDGCSEEVVGDLVGRVVGFVKGVEDGI